MIGRAALGCRTSLRISCKGPLHGPLIVPPRARRMYRPRTFGGPAAWFAEGYKATGPRDLCAQDQTPGAFVSYIRLLGSAGPKQSLLQERKACRSFDQDRRSDSSRATRVQFLRLPRRALRAPMPTSAGSIRTPFQTGSHALSRFVCLASPGGRDHHATSGSLECKWAATTHQPPKHIVRSNQHDRYPKRVQTRTIAAGRRRSRKRRHRLSRPKMTAPS